MHKLLSRKKAAHYLGVSPFTLDRWKGQGRIAFIRLGRRNYFDEKDLEDFIQMNKVQVRDVWAIPPEDETGPQSSLSPESEGKGLYNCT